MVVTMEEFQQEGFVVEPQKMVKQQRMLRILHTIVRMAHRVYSVLKIMPEFVKIQFAETHSKLSKVR